MFELEYGTQINETYMKSYDLFGVIVVLVRVKITSTTTIRKTVVLLFLLSKRKQ